MDKNWHLGTWVQERYSSFVPLLLPTSRRVCAGVFCFVTSACVDLEPSVPEGKWVQVGNVSLGPSEMSQRYSELDAFGRVRFRGVEGRRVLLDSMIARELLDLEAKAAGMDSDPRIEEIVHATRLDKKIEAELERRLPRARIEQNHGLLKDYYREHSEEFRKPQRRGIRAVVFKSWPEAERAWKSVKSGEKRLEDLGTVARTPLAERDDHEYPGFHRLLFAEGLSESELLAQPVYADRRLLVAEVDKIEAGRVLSFPELIEDSDAFTRLVDAVYAEQSTALKAEIRAELK